MSNDFTPPLSFTLQLTYSLVPDTFSQNCHLSVDVNTRHDVT